MVIFRDEVQGCHWVKKKSPFWCLWSRPASRCKIRAFAPRELSDEQKDVIKSLLGAANVYLTSWSKTTEELLSEQPPAPATPKCLLLLRTSTLTHSQGDMDYLVLQAEDPKGWSRA